MDEVLYPRATREAFTHEHLFFRDAKLKEYFEKLQLPEAKKPRREWGQTVDRSEAKPASQRSAPTPARKRGNTTPTGCS